MRDRESRAAGYRAGARAMAPLAVAIAVLGVVFGYQATEAGMSPLAATLMSATTFAGSAQFGAVAILGAGGSSAAAVGTAALLNARYVMMGAAMAPVIKGNRLRRSLLAQLVVDESWAVANQEPGKFSATRLIGAGLVLYVTHVLATAAGALGGTSLGDPRRLGLDAAFPALFLTLLWPHLKNQAARVPAVLGAAVTLSLIPVAPPGIPILAAGLVPLLFWRPD